MTLEIQRIDHVVMTVRDVEATAAWYVRVLGFRRETFGAGNRVAIRFGQQKFNLRPMGDAEWTTSPVAEPGHLDLCFMTHGPIAAVVDQFKRCDVAVEYGPSRQIGALGPMTSVYCSDPDGNLIEIASYDDPGSD